MIITVNNKDLKEALNAVSKASTDKGIQPILGNVLIKTIDQNFISLQCTDLDIYIKKEISGYIEKQGTVAINVKKLIEITRNFGNENIKISLDEQNKATITCKNAVFNVMCQSPEEFPLIERKECDFNAELPIDETVLAFKQVLISTASGETNNVLCGISFKFDRKIIELASTDGNRLTRKIIKPVKADDKAIQAIIPARALKEVISNASQCTDESMYIGIKDGQVYFEMDYIQITSRLLEGRYPDYPKLIPVNFDHQVVLDKQGFQNSLRSVSTMANERTNVVKLDFKGIILELSSSCADIGEAKDFISFNSKQLVDLNTAVNYRLLLDTLSVINDKEVIINLNGTLAPIVITTDGDPNYLSLIMPIQVK